MSQAGLDFIFHKDKRADKTGSDSLKCGCTLRSKPPQNPLCKHSFHLGVSHLKIHPNISCVLVGYKKITFCSGLFKTKISYTKDIVGVDDTFHTRCWNMAGSLSWKHGRVHRVE